VYITPRAWYDGTTIQTKGTIMDYDFDAELLQDYRDEMERDWNS
jgi:hypothetical protein